MMIGRPGAAAGPEVAEIAATLAAAFGLDYAAQDPGADAAIVLQPE